jgi:hypothetical protein
MQSQALIQLRAEEVHETQAITLANGQCRLNENELGELFSELDGVYKDTLREAGNSDSPALASAVGGAISIVKESPTARPNGRSGLPSNLAWNRHIARPGERASRAGMRKRSIRNNNWSLCPFCHYRTRPVFVPTANA